jgi:signal transduction histidine kinase
LVAVEVSNSQGSLAFASDTAARVDDAMRQPLRGFPGVVARIALRPAARGVLLVSPPERSRLPLLVGLLLLCVVLALVALIQLRREHELARHMVENVLHFSRRRDAPDVRLEELELLPYLEDVAASFTPLATAQGMRVAVDADALSVRTDPAMLRQVLLNLLDNAVKYGRTGQRITIAAHLADGDASPDSAGAPRAVRLTVSDEGPGIPASDRERVWSPYVRLRENGAPRRTGSGIGLAVVRELVEAMRGRTWVESAHADGRGAKFVIELPSAAEPVSHNEGAVPTNLTSRVMK